MANKWITHIKKTMKTMKRKGTYKKGLGLKQVITEAKKTWHKGGADPEPMAEKVDTAQDSDTEEPTGKMDAGRRRRSNKRTRRHRRR
jgi:hypothetical protein